MNITKENVFKGNIADPYSIVHIINGFNISLFLELFVTDNKTKIFTYGFIFHLLYEIKDFLFYYKYKKKLIKPNLSILPFIIYDYSRNTFLNSLGDQIFHTIGYFVYLNIKKKYEFTKNQYIVFFFISNILAYFLIQIYNDNTSKKK